VTNENREEKEKEESRIHRSMAPASCFVLVQFFQSLAPENTSQLSRTRIDSLDTASLLGNCPLRSFVFFNVSFFCVFRNACLIKNKAKTKESTGYT
jgi:hypothetical protein